MFKIGLLSGKIKFGSSGEKLNNASNNSKPIITVAIQKVSISLLVTNFNVLLANLLISIKLMNQINHFVSSNVYC